MEEPAPQKDTVPKTDSVTPLDAREGLSPAPRDKKHVLIVVGIAVLITILAIAIVVLIGRSGKKRVPDTEMTREEAFLELMRSQNATTSQLSGTAIPPTVSRGPSSTEEERQRLIEHLNSQ